MELLKKILNWDNSILFIFFILITIISFLISLFITTNLWDYILSIYEFGKSKIINLYHRLKSENINNSQELDFLDKEENENDSNDNIVIESINNEEKDVKYDINGEKKEDERKNLNQDEIIFFNLSSDMKFVFTFFGRLLITIYSFHGLFFLYNFIIQNLSLIAMLYYYLDKIFYQISLAIFYFIFAILSSNVMVIPTYEFLTFPFIKYKNPWSHLETFKYIIKNEKFDSKEITGKNNKVLNIFLVLLSFFYLYGFFLGLFSNSAFLKNIVELIILFYVYSHYLVLFFCYIITSMCVIFISIFKKLNAKQHILPNINLLSYSINPIYKDNYRENEIIKEEYIFYDARNIIRIFLLILLFSITLILSYYIKRDIGLTIMNLIFNISLLTLSIVLNFPFCFKNNKTFDSFFQSKIILKKEAKPKHPYILPVIRIICNIIFISIWLILSAAFFFFEEQKNENFKDKFEQIFEKKIDKNRLLPHICNSYIYNLPIYLYIPFINDAYYYKNINDTNISSSFDYQNYKKIFFDDKYDIKPIGNLINENETVKMIQYNVKNSEKNISITILSIKGHLIKKIYIWIFNYLCLQFF